jgi:hypothetical protein
LGIGDWAQSPIPNPQSPIPNPHNEGIKYIILKKNNNFKLLFINLSKIIIYTKDDRKRYKRRNKRIPK